VTHGYTHPREPGSHGPGHAGRADTTDLPESDSAATGSVETKVGEPVVSDGTMGMGDGMETGPGVDEATDAAYRAGGSSGSADEHPDTARAAQLTEDLRRLNAEYVNYKKRVDRDRDVAREQGVAHVLEALLPVLDDLHLARQHGDLDDGPMTAIAEKLEATLARLGVERFGEVGDPFDPMHHEALMHLDVEVPEGSESTTVVQVLQPGFRLGERVVRAARVAVADPQ